MSFFGFKGCTVQSPFGSYPKLSNMHTVLLLDTAALHTVYMYINVEEFCFSLHTFTQHAEYFQIKVFKINVKKIVVWKQRTHYRLENWSLCFIETLHKQ